MPEDRLARHDWLVDTVRPAHFPGTLHDSKDLREGCGMTEEPAAGRTSEAKLNRSTSTPLLH